MNYRLDLTGLSNAYDEGISPVEIIRTAFKQIDEIGQAPIWISVVDREAANASAQWLTTQDRSALPLYGVPFAVKDNIDVAGMATTAGCPAYSYIANKSATVVENLINAGAILIGKTNLDQFATGLVGVRTPYGICRSPFDSDYISGGSSSGSAVAVSQGLVSFALGTDTAGSGRVPASFNNIVGLKPTRGVISAAGVVPACKSLDCVSIFALTTNDAKLIFECAQGFDSQDPFSRSFDIECSAEPWVGAAFNFGILRHDQRTFFGDIDAEKLYEEAITGLVSIGGVPVEFDYQPLLESATLLYSGPWVAERLAAIKSFYEQHKDKMNSVVANIIGKASEFSAVDSYEAFYKLVELRQVVSTFWEHFNFMLLPTTGTTYKVADIEVDPVTLNSNLGYYTNFVNLLDMTAIAIPAGFRCNGLPFGVTFVGRAFSDTALMTIGDQLHRLLSTTVGALETNLSTTDRVPKSIIPPGCTLLAVVGAHLMGQPLNHQLTNRNAKLHKKTLTAPHYRLFALSNTTPAKPGLVMAPGYSGTGIEVEVWAIPTRLFGSFVAEIPQPLGIGTIELADKTKVKGFICEPSALSNAIDITEHGGWRNYLASIRK